MKTPMKKADAGTSATKNKLRNRIYSKDIPLSSLRLQIGDLLLLLFTGHRPPDEWKRFERLLHQFYDVGAL